MLENMDHPGVEKTFLLLDECQREREKAHGEKK